MAKIGKDLRKAVENIAINHFFYTASASVYGGVSGLYDFGPLGCRLKNNIIKAWRKFFVLKENMSEVDCSTITPESVLKASGHVDKFEDLMVRDTITNECFRADHLIEEKLASLLSNVKLEPKKRVFYQDIKNKINDMDRQKISGYIKELKINSPTTGNLLSDAFSFNLMFSTPIGPTGKLKGFLRPETAQGMFLNFNKLLSENGGKLPFAAAQIGTAYRNEISPRSGLLRVREFEMAEIEHFCEKDSKKHHRFDEHKNTVVTLWKRDNQINNKRTEKMTIHEAVQKKLIANETLGFYVAKTQLFLERIGIDVKRLRFRQHLKNEMAHYAADCWDAEILSSYGWIECVGIADRSCYDLTNHSKHSGVELSVHKNYSQPKKEKIKIVNLNVPLVGKTFRTDSKKIINKFKSLSNEEVERFRASFEDEKKANLEIDGEQYEITKEMVKNFEEKEIIVKGYNFTPNVIEPSFGIGRIFYSLLEHSFKERKNDSERKYLSFTVEMSPVPVILLPLSSNKSLAPIVDQIHKNLVSLGVYSATDSSNVSIGRRYARADERGVFYCLTVDFESEKDQSFTIRNRDSMEQVRVKGKEGLSIVKKLAKGKLSWGSVKERK